MNVRFSGTVTVDDSIYFRTWQLNRATFERQGYDIFDYPGIQTDHANGDYIKKYLNGKDPFVQSILGNRGALKYLAHNNNGQSTDQLEITLYSDKDGTKGTLTKPRLPGESIEQFINFFLTVTAGKLKTFLNSP